MEETEKDSEAGKAIDTEKIAPKLTTKENILQMLKFTLFMSFAGIIQFVSFTILSEVLHLRYWAAHLIAIVLSVLFSFTINRKFTFKSVSNVTKAAILVIIFYGMFIPASTWQTKYLTETLAWNGFLVECINLVENLILEYLWYRFVVYKNSINSSKTAQNNHPQSYEK